MMVQHVRAHEQRASNGDIDADINDGVSSEDAGIGGRMNERLRLAKLDDQKQLYTQLYPLPVRSRVKCDDSELSAWILRTESASFI